MGLESTAMKTSSLRIGSGIISLVALALTFAPACGGSSVSNCIAACEEAQEGGCTVIKGNCTAFCNAADAIRVDSGCGDEQDAYQSCLDQGPVCDQSCDATEGAFQSCVLPYCLQHASDESCQTLAGSF